MAKCKTYMGSLDPARLRELVDIQTATTPTTGETTPTYANLATGLWAEVLETGGSEYIRGRQIEAGISAIVTIRYRADVTPRMRVKWGSRYLYVVYAIDPTGQRVATELLCKEVQP